ncbi:hypothetical protein ACWC2T_44210 [Streptomyces sp. NPDC001393]
MRRQPDDSGFILAVERWTPEDWQEYRDRVADGEGSVAAIDAITRRRRRPSREGTRPAAEASK